MNISVKRKIPYFSVIRHDTRLESRKLHFIFKNSIHSFFYETRFCRKKSKIETNFFLLINKKRISFNNIIIIEGKSLNIFLLCKGVIAQFAIGIKIRHRKIAWSGIETRPLLGF